MRVPFTLIATLTMEAFFPIEIKIEKKKKIENTSILDFG